MKNFIVEIASQTASFRDPNFQNYHKSLMLPPPTTIMGLTGAALGFSPLRAQEFFDENNIEMGVYGVFKGKCQDTWKYNKGIRDMRLYDPGIDGSIIQKEFLIENVFYIAFSSNDKEALNQMKKGFESPTYALTMGNSDSLAKVVDIVVDLPISENNELENTFINGDVVNKVLSVAQEKKELEFSLYTNDSLVYDLPIRFEYESDYGKRKISSVETYSFIGGNMKLNYKVKGLEYKNIFIPLFKL